MRDTKTDAQYWRRFLYGGCGGIRTPVGVTPNGFQDRLVMTASIRIHIISPKNKIIFRGPRPPCGGCSRWSRFAFAHLCCYSIFPVSTRNKNLRFCCDRSFAALIRFGGAKLAIRIHIISPKNKIIFRGPRPPCGGCSRWSRFAFAHLCRYSIFPVSTRNKNFRFCCGGAFSADNFCA